MQDAAFAAKGGPEISKAMRRTGSVIAVMTASGFAKYEFPTETVESLVLTLEGIPGDRHFGFVSKADSRMPWTKRGTPVRNARALSLVSSADLAAMAVRLGIPAVDPRWLGVNVVADGIQDFTFLPRGTRLLIGGESGPVLVVEDLNKPCRIAGKIVASHSPGRPEIELEFAKRAAGLRGVVASVERAGTIVPDAKIEALIPEQWIYS